MAETPPTPLHVLVIGGGAAGLAAASLLHSRAGVHHVDGAGNRKRAIRVTILEARHRLGGRIDTYRSSRRTEGDDDEPPYVAERGAAWIHGASADNNPIKNLADEHRLTLYPTILTDVALYAEEQVQEEDEGGGGGRSGGGGSVARRVPKRDVRLALADFAAQDGLLFDMLEGSDEEDSDDGNGGTTRNEMSLKEGLRSIGLFTSTAEQMGPDPDPMMRHRVAEWLWLREELDCGASLADLSLSAWMGQAWDNEGGGGSDGDGDGGGTSSSAVVGEVLVLDGYDQVVDAMAGGLPEGCVELGTIVREVRLVTSGREGEAPRRGRPSGVEVVCEKRIDGESKNEEGRGKTSEPAIVTRRADAVICTVPLGCLRAHDVKFVPGTDGLREVGYVPERGGLRDEDEEKNERETEDGNGGNNRSATSSDTKSSSSLNDSERNSKKRTQVEMGLLNRVVLTFREPFWQEPLKLRTNGDDKDQEDDGPGTVDECDYIGWMPATLPVGGADKCIDDDHEGTNTVPPTPLEYTNLHEQCFATLAVQFAGRDAVALEACPDDDRIIKACMKPLRRIYGRRCTDPIRAIVTRWRGDPFARGSYSMLPVGCGSAAEAHGSLGGPVGGTEWGRRLLFAGEATSPDHPGTVWGAFESGEREAERVLKRFR